MTRFFVAMIALASVASSLAGQDTREKPKPRKKDPNVIASWEIDSLAPEARNAHEIVTMLRPKFFQVRSRQAPGDNPLWGRGPALFVDDSPRGSLEGLVSIPRSGIREIRYISGPDAASRYGAEYHAGIVQVVMN